VVVVVLTAPRVEVSQGTLLTCANERIATAPASTTAGPQIDTRLDSGVNDPYGLFGAEDTPEPAHQAPRPPAGKPAGGRVIACVTDIRTTGTRLAGVLLASGFLVFAFARLDSAAERERGS